MINQQLFDYIKQQLAQGVSKEVININLLSQGWQQGDINEAFSMAENQNIAVPVPIVKTFNLADKLNSIRPILKVASFFAIPIFMGILMFLAAEHEKYVNKYFYLMMYLLLIPLFASIKAKGSMRKLLVFSITLSLAAEILYNVLIVLFVQFPGPTSKILFRAFLIPGIVNYILLETVIAIILMYVIEEIRYFFTKNKNIINQQLVDYIKQQLAQGMTKEIVSSNLIQQNWQQQDINKAFSAVENQSVGVQSEISIRDASKNKWAIAGLVVGLIELIFRYSSFPYSLFLHSSSSFPSDSEMRLFSIVSNTLVCIGIIGIILSIKGLKSKIRIVAIAGAILNLTYLMSGFPLVLSHIYMVILSHIM